MPLNCPEIRTSLDLLALKQASFKVATEEALQGGDFTHAKQLKKEIESLNVSLHKAIVPTQIEQVEALFDSEHLITPEDIEKTFHFQIETKDIPLIPFTTQELQEAKDKGQTLRLTWDMLPDGTNLSGEKMTELLGEKQQNGNPLINYHFDKNDPTFTEESPRRGWALTSNEVTYTSENYLEQTDLPIKECPDTPTYQKAIQAYEKQKPYIQRLWRDYDKNWQEIAKILGTLEITTLTRDSFLERFQQMIVHNQKTGKNILADMYYWTNSRSSYGNFVDVGYFGDDGMNVYRDDPRDACSDLGICFSRRV